MKPRKRQGVGSAGVPAGIRRKQRFPGATIQRGRKPSNDLLRRSSTQVVPNPAARAQPPQEQRRPHPAVRKSGARADKEFPAASFSRGRSA